MTATPADGTTATDRAASDGPAAREGRLVPVASIEGRALVTVIAIMTFLASLAAGGAVLVIGASQDWQQSVSREMTIQVRPTAGLDVDAEVAKAVDIARNTPGVKTVSAMSKGETQQMLEPWLGQGLDLAELPIPRLIVVTLSDATRLDAGALRKALEERVRGVDLDDHRFWLARLSAMTGSVIVAAVLVFALVVVAMGLAVAFATRGVVAGNREIIGVLHFVGAEDRFIAAEFQRHFLRLGLKGALVGGGCASLVFAAAGVAWAALSATPGGAGAEALIGLIALGPKGHAVILAVALGIGCATGFVSRAIVLRHLRAME